MTQPAPTCHCGQAATKTIVYINRRSQKPMKQAPMCDTHVQQELVLAITSLSMVDIDIRPLESIS